jgi:acyl-CoA thioester hydrolase
MAQKREPCYFTGQPGDPEPLCETTERVVRFEELDPLNIVWHGRYASYLEDGRVAFGQRYGLGYRIFFREKIAAPIVRMHIDYHAPLCFEDSFLIRTSLHWSEAVRLNFSYRLTNKKTGALVATGYTVQLILDGGRNLMLVMPDAIFDFMNAWKENRLE